LAIQMTIRGWVCWRAAHRALAKSRPADDAGVRAEVTAGASELDPLALHYNRWERSSVPLKFQIGDVHLGKVVMTLLRRTAGLDERPLDIGDTPEPPAELDGADGYVVWSQPLIRRLPVFSLCRGAVLYAPRQYRRFSIQFAGSFEQYMARFSGKTRSGIRRKLRKFAEASGGLIDWREYPRPTEISLFFPLAKKVSSRTYQERLLKIGFPDDPEFLTSELARSENDGVRAYILFLNGNPVSYLYCRVKDKIVSYNYHGYDPAFAKLSPGTVLQILALEALFAEQRFTTFDFTEGEGSHKERLSTGHRLCGDVYVIRRRFMPISFVMLHHAVNTMSVSAGNLLDHVKLKSPLRRLLRGT
jgi:hypothetical protein